MEQPNIDEWKTIQWLEPWEAFPIIKEPRTDGDLTGYDLELVREVGPKHPLFPYKSLAIPVGVRSDCDDRLYWIPNMQHPFVVVHITWAGKAQQVSSEYPQTEFYKSLNDWKEQRMKKDCEFISTLKSRQS